MYKITKFTKDNCYLLLAPELCQPGALPAAGQHGAGDGAVVTLVSSLKHGDIMAWQVIMTK